MERFSDAEIYAMMFACANFTGGSTWRRGDQAAALGKLTAELHRRQGAAEVREVPISAPMDFEWGGSVILPLP